MMLDLAGKSTGMDASSSSSPPTAHEHLEYRSGLSLGLPDLPLHRVDDGDSARVVKAALRILTKLRISQAGNVLQPLDATGSPELVHILDLQAHALNRDECRK
jgi:hypothetical protein